LPPLGTCIALNSEYPSADHRDRLSAMARDTIGISGGSVVG
jgi:hypothetical protein